ncbi:hypothetical protein, partial [uncultured Halomonas sp.]|uniref:hypothetical protein n=1 Tax=uncultured Halomonas sp. TaxID=173971 RepID=UPI00261A0BB6
MLRPAMRSAVRGGLRPAVFPPPWWGAADPLRALIDSLFGNGEQGAMYVPQPKYLFQDAAGTTPVTADGDPVGLMLDLSGNGNHA